MFVIVLVVLAVATIIGGKFLEKYLAERHLNLYVQSRVLNRAIRHNNAKVAVSERILNKQPITKVDGCGKCWVDKKLLILLSMEKNLFLKECYPAMTSPA